MPSYSPVFSSQFIVYTDATPNTLFEVPSGFTAVVRDFTAFATASLTLVQLSISDSTGAPECTFASLNLTGLEIAQQWTGRVVVPENGFIVLTAGTLRANLQAYVGGYLLRNNLA